MGKSRATAKSWQNHVNFMKGGLKTCSIDTQNIVEAGVYAGEYPQKLTSDILWETSVILGVKSDQTQKSVKK